MNTQNRKPQAAALKAVTTKLPIMEINQLVEQAEKECTTVSAVIRAAIQQRRETTELHRELGKLRLMQERFLLELMGEVHNIPTAELHTIRNNLKRKLQAPHHEQ